MVKRNQILPVILTAGVILAGFGLYSRLSNSQLPASDASALGAENVRAEVLEIREEGEIDMGGVPQHYQIARVELLEGDFAGLIKDIDYGRRQLFPPGTIYLQPGDEILVVLGQDMNGALTVYFADFVRINPLLWLFAIFAIAILLISSWKGLRSLLSMMFSLMVIIGYIIPSILTGNDPLMVSISGSILLLAVTLYLTYGWNLKTHAAVVSMVLVLLITGILAVVFVNTTRLRGTGDESALFLLQSMNLQINLRGLLLGGMIIGALGVLDDLVTTQASAVFELHHANTALGFRALFQSAMRIGQDHVAATVNTLVLAYAGASLPLFLLFSQGSGNYGTLINFEFVAAEIVRTLVGSLGLVTAVPLTTAIAIFFALSAESFGWARQFLGPEGGGDGHLHRH